MYALFYPVNFIRFLEYNKRKAKVEMFSENIKTNNIPILSACMHGHQNRKRRDKSNYFLH